MENTIEASSFILSLIKDAYKVPFHTSLEPIFSSNNKSAGIHSEFASSVINELPSSDCVIKQHTLLCYILTVSRL